MRVKWLIAILILVITVLLWQACAQDTALPELETLPNNTESELTVPIESETVAPTEPETATVDELKTGLIMQINKIRTERRLVPLAEDEYLNEIASHLAIIMMERTEAFGTFDYIKRKQEFELRANYIFNTYPSATIVAANFASLPDINSDTFMEELIDEWYYDTIEARSNILDPRFTKTGVGLQSSANNYYAVQIFSD